jgi:hypothetical protein
MVSGEIAGLLQEDTERDFKQEVTEITEGGGFKVRHFLINRLARGCAAGLTPPETYQPFPSVR